MPALSLSCFLSREPPRLLHRGGVMEVKNLVSCHDAKESKPQRSDIINNRQLKYLITAETKCAARGRNFKDGESVLKWIFSNDNWIARYYRPYESYWTTKEGNTNLPLQNYFLLSSPFVISFTAYRKEGETEYIKLIKRKLTVRE